MKVARKNPNAIRYASRDGYLHFLKVLDQTRFLLTRPNDVSDWLNHVSGCNSEVWVQCKDCKAVVSTSPKQFCYAMRARCFCVGKVRCHEPAYYDRLCNMLEDNGNVKLVGINSYAEWSRSMKTSHNVTLCCLVCGTTATKSLPPPHKITEMRMQCHCNGQLSYSSGDGYRKLIEMLQNSRFVPTESLGCGSLDLNAESIISLQCGKCERVVETTINRIQRGDVGCGCLNSTELVVFRALDAHLDNGTLHVAGQKKFPESLTGVGGRALSFDISVENGDGKCLLLVEVDGGHHFGCGHALLKRDDDHTEEHDVMKERFCITNRIPLARIEVDTVRKGRADWKKWILDIADEMQIGNSTRLLHCKSSGNHYLSDRWLGRRIEDEVLCSHVAGNIHCL